MAGRIMGVLGKGVLPQSSWCPTRGWTLALWAKSVDFTFDALINVDTELADWAEYRAKWYGESRG